MDWEKLLEKASSRVEEAEVFQKKSIETSLSLRRKEIQGIKIAFNTQNHLRIVKGHKVGFSSTTNLEENEEEMIKQSMLGIHFNSDKVLHFPSDEKYSLVKVFDKNIEVLDVDHLILKARELEDELSEARIGIERFFEIRAEQTDVLIANTNGLYNKYAKTMLTIFVAVQIFRNIPQYRITNFISTCKMESNENALAETLQSRAKMPIVHIQKHTKLPIIIMPYAISILISPLVLNLSGEAVLDGLSRMNTKINQEIFDERLTIIDDGSIDWMPGSAPSDDEGVHTCRKPLIESGTVKNLYHTLETAYSFNDTFTGNGKRGFNSPPIASPTNIIVLPGDVTTEELIEDLQRGIVVQEAVLRNSSNAFSGEIIVDVTQSQFIQDGSIEGNLNSFALSFNLFDVAKKLNTIGRNVETFGNLISPPIMLTPLSIKSQ
jgi:PmbA protein